MGRAAETVRLPVTGMPLPMRFRPSTITIYRPGSEPEVHTNPSSVQGTSSVAGFEFVLSRIWE
jgi:hypothetical protein